MNDGILAGNLENLENLETLETLEPLEPLEPLELDILETAGKFNGMVFLKIF